MKPSAPWSIKGIDPDAREAAKKLAADAGMTLGDWFNHVLLNGALPRSPASGDGDSIARPAPVTRMSAQAAQPVASGVDAAAFTSSMNDLATRLDAAETRSVTDMSDIRRHLEGIQDRVRLLEERPDAVSEDVETALREIAGHVADTRARTEEALSTTERVLEEVTGRIEQSVQKSNDAVTTVGRAIELMAARLSALEQEVEESAARALDAAQRQPATAELRATLPATQFVADAAPAQPLTPITALSGAALPGAAPQDTSDVRDLDDDWTRDPADRAGAADDAGHDDLSLDDPDDLHPAHRAGTPDTGTNAPAAKDPFDVGLSELDAWDGPEDDQRGADAVAPERDLGRDLERDSGLVQDTDDFFEEVTPRDDKPGRASLTERLMARVMEDEETDAPVRPRQPAPSARREGVDDFLNNFGDDDDADMPPGGTGQSATAPQAPDSSALVSDGRARRPEDVIAAIRRAARGESVAAPPPVAAPGPIQTASAQATSVLARATRKPAFDADEPLPLSLRRGRTSQPDARQEWPEFPEGAPSEGDGVADLPEIAATVPGAGKAAGAAAAQTVRDRRGGTNRTVMYLLITVAAAVIVGSVGFWASKQGYF